MHQYKGGKGVSLKHRWVCAIQLFEVTGRVERKSSTRLIWSSEKAAELCLVLLTEERVYSNHCTIGPCSYLFYQLKEGKRII